MRWPLLAWKKMYQTSIAKSVLAALLVQSLCLQHATHPHMAAAAVHPVQACTRCCTPLMRQRAAILCNASSPGSAAMLAKLLPLWCGS